MPILSNLPHITPVCSSESRGNPLKRRFALRLGFGAVALTALIPAFLPSRVKADPIDLTTLPAFYVLGPTDIVPGPYPGFSETATANLLTVTGEKNLSSVLTTFNGPTPTITGDFTATVTSTVDTYAYGGLYAGFGAAYAGITFGSGVLYTSAGLTGGGAVVLSNESIPVSDITVRISRSGADLALLPPSEAAFSTRFTH
jgi:hypothetical protein